MSLSEKCSFLEGVNNSLILQSSTEHSPLKAEWRCSFFMLISITCYFFLEALFKKKSLKEGKDLKNCLVLS